jgi:A/G-specific adenine glycosylase
MSAIAAALLAWYDQNARALPWRVGPAAIRAGRRPDPYRVWLSEIMLQQTTVAAVAPRFADFIARWPSVEALAAAPLDEVLSAWAGLGYYARARNLHRCAAELARRGRFPETEAELRTLPGIGGYTAAAIAAIAFDAPAIVVDGNVERVAARLFAAERPIKEATPALRARLEAIWPQRRSGDFAQGLMDLGALLCTPRRPKCPLCPLKDNCEGLAKGIAERLPAKAAKKQKPLRRGIAYALVNARGEMLFERRPEKGLLGGMLGLPGTEWAAEADAPPPARSPLDGADWRPAGTVRHSFTHFDLALEVMTARAPKRFRPSAAQRWIAPDAARLPTVMKKAVERARRA